MADRMTDAECARAWAAWILRNQKKWAYAIPVRVTRIYASSQFVRYLYGSSWDHGDADVAALRLCLAADVMETL